MLHALGAILLRAIPTFLMVVVLHFYLKSVFFMPLEKVLDQRREATEGARQLAQQSLDEAAAKTAEYEEKLRAAKSELYQAQEKLHKEIQQREAAAIAEARAAADAATKTAKAELSAEMVGLKGQLAAQSDSLAAQIEESIVGRSAAA